MVGRGLALRGAPPCLLTAVVGVLLLLGTGLAAAVAGPAVAAAGGLAAGSTPTGSTPPGSAPTAAMPSGPAATGSTLAADARTGQAGQPADPHDEHATYRPSAQPTAPLLGGGPAVVPAPAPAAVAAVAALQPGSTADAPDPGGRSATPARAPPHPAF